MSETPPTAPESVAAKPVATPETPSKKADAEAVRPEDYLDLRVSAERATLLIKASVQLTPIEMTVDLLKANLARTKIKMPVDDNLLRDIIDNKQFDKAHVLAVAKPVVEGKDAGIEEMVKIDPDITPKILQNGRVDYKNIDNIHTVEAGTVLAVKHPATLGEEGMDVFGKVTPPKPGKDAQFKVGLNVTTSPDGLQLIAATGGFLYRQAGAICIGDGYIVKGDVGFKTGNIRYHGVVQVQGGVCEGFTVEADGDVTIDGSVDGSSVTSRQGGVLIKETVFGHHRSHIRSKTKMHVTAAQDAHLECEGVLEIKKLLRNCQAAGGEVHAEASGCVIQGGRLTAYGNIHLAGVGGEGLHTEVGIIDREAEQRRQDLEKLKSLAAVKENQVRALEQKLKGMKALTNKPNVQITERMAAELKTSVQKHADLQREWQEVIQKRSELEGAMRSAQNHPGFIAIKEKVLGSVKINLYGHGFELGSEDGGKKWLWAEDGVVSAPF